MELRRAHLPSLLIRVALVVIFLYSAAQLLQFAYRAATNLLLQDFSAYYTAGQALNYGQSPYLNNLSNIPPLWDGIAHFRYSRFLYPPLVAVFFQPFALLPYSIAKILWVLLTLVCLGLSLLLTSRLFPLRTPNQSLIVGIGVCLYYPLYTHLDRGQIDLIILLLIVLSVGWIDRRTKKTDLAAGLLLAFATLLKLHCAYVLPFLLIRRKWHVFAGFLYGGLLILAASVIILGGFRSLYDYVRYQLPRISGITSPDDTLGKANKTVLEALIANVPVDSTVQDGQIYQSSTYSSLAQVSLVAPVYYDLAGQKIFVSRTLLSVVFFAFLFLLIWIWERKVAHAGTSGRAEFLYWQIPFLVILLTAPLTWVMNTVWVLPFSVVLASIYPDLSKMGEKISFGIMTVGYLLLLVPENTLPVLNFLLLNKSIYAELTVLIGLLLFLSASRKLVPAASEPRIPGSGQGFSKSDVVK